MLHPGLVSVQPDDSPHRHEQQRSRSTERDLVVTRYCADYRFQAPPAHAPAAAVAAAISAAAASAIAATPAVVPSSAHQRAHAKAPTATCALWQLAPRSVTAAPAALQISHSLPLALPGDRVTSAKRDGVRYDGEHHRYAAPWARISSA